MITQIKKTRLHRLPKIGITNYFQVRPNPQSAIRNPQSKLAGFSFIELLAVIVVIGVLTLVALAAYQGKRDEAKTAAAWHEMKQLADAEKTVEMYYGYFVPLSVLNDVPGDKGDYPLVTNPDCIGLLPRQNGYNVIDPETGRSGNPVETLYSSPVKFIILPIGYSGPYKDMLHQNAHKWKGPFVTFERQVPLATGGQFAGMPLDPWGGPYWLFTRCYAVDFMGAPFTAYSINTLDRFAIVSFGKDSTFPTGDDLVYTFK